MSTLSPRFALVGIALVALAFAACTGSEARTSTPGASTKAAATGEVTTSAQVQSATAEPPPQVMFVANTGGTGVSLRTRCEDGARVAGPGLKDATEVVVTTVGSGACSGWALVDAGGTTTWVHLSYLQAEQPPAAAAPAVGRPASRPVVQNPPPAPPPPAPAARIEKVLVYGEHLIPLSQLTYRAANHSQILMTPTGPTPGAYTCPVYNYSSPVVRTVAGAVLYDPDPLGCGFARVDQAVIRDALIQ